MIPHCWLYFALYSLAKAKFSSVYEGIDRPLGDFAKICSEFAPIWAALSNAKCNPHAIDVCAPIFIDQDNM